VNLENQSYDIILGAVTNITSTIVTTNSNGGENIVIKSSTKVSFLFNKSDTCGNILGFNNVGDSNSITDFKSIITNQDTYINNINLDSIGNVISYSNGYFNFAGQYNYILMYLNNIELIYNTNNLPSAFGKILLSEPLGSILFNTFVALPNNIDCKSFPITTLVNLNISFLYPDGTNVDFRNMNHSFSLKITEEQYINDNTNLNSNIISVIDELANSI
jgi:hypothetical protein